MQSSSKRHSVKTSRLLGFFILFWVLLNFLQAAFVGIDPDEAYYWLYAQHLAWGYFDHPPVVALLIKSGETLGHGPVYTRLATVLLSGGTVYFGFKALPDYLADVRTYLFVFLSVVLFHVYGFIATPDAALLFFTTLFFYAYKTYLGKETPVHTAALALSITALLYSKYHGVLPVFFTVLSNPKLLKKPSAWAAALLVLLLFSPHLWWQYQHDWPTFRYHLSERIASPYAIKKTVNYIAGQLLIWGPFTTIPALYFFLKGHRSYSQYERAHLFTFWGVFLFFFISSFRSTIEPHWTLVAGPSFIILLQGVLKRASLKLKKAYAALSITTIFLLLAGRVLFMLPASPVKKLRAFDALANAPSWTEKLYRFAQGRPVVFFNSYRLPAIYQYYYPGAKTWGYNTVTYRKTQFNLFSDAFLNNGPVCLAGTERWNGYTNFFKNPYDTLYLQSLPAYTSVSNLKLTLLQEDVKFIAGQKPAVTIQIYNVGNDTLAAKGLSINYTFLKTRSEQYTPQSTVSFNETFLPPGYKKTLSLPLELPTVAGTYELIFSIVQPPFAGTFASPFYKVNVN